MCSSDLHSSLSLRFSTHHETTAKEGEFSSSPTLKFTKLPAIPMCSSLNQLAFIIDTCWSIVCTQPRYSLSQVQHYSFKYPCFLPSLIWSSGRSLSFFIFGMANSLIFHFIACPSFRNWRKIIECCNCKENCECD